MKRLDGIQTEQQPMRWEKLGQVFCPENHFPWMRTHAANPVAELLEGTRIRVYFSSRDGQNRSSIGTVELDLNKPSDILALSEQPILSPGPIGVFDDSGVSMGCLVHHESRRYLYYLGWNLGVTVPWRNSIGLAISEGPNEPFQKHSLAPVLDRNPIDPYSVSYPWILLENNRWRMWYGSNLKWGPEQRDMEHLIKYAESADGIHWEPTGQIAVPFHSEDEYAMSKPCVIAEQGIYKMWYSYRGAAYRIGYAESMDGFHWQRLDHLAGILPSPSGWDSETVEYPCVFDCNGERYMLYNGNQYGRTGFGIARLVR